MSDHSILNSIDSPADLRKLPESQLEPLAEEIRDFLIRWASQNSGHFAASLGMVELTIALHYIYNTPDDRLVWDVGHQAYVHKILTGRRDRLHSIRKWEGLAPFPKRSESEYDAFGVGHPVLPSVLLWVCRWQHNVPVVTGRLWQLSETVALLLAWRLKR